MTREHGVAGWLVVLATLSLGGCGAGDRAERVEARVPVQVRDVGTGDVEDTIVATGTLRSGVSASLYAESPGLLKVARAPSGRELREGDQIEAGQMLAEITGDEVRLAARTEATLERYEVAQRDFDVKRRLFAEGLISSFELEQAEASLAEAKAEWERSRLIETRTRMISPIDGTVMRLARDEQGRRIADGQRVAVGSLIAEIAPTDKLVADIDLVGQDALRVEPEMAALVRYFAWDERRFPARVTRLAPNFDPVTRAHRAEITVDNGEGLLRPGMFIEATIVVERRDGVPVVPREAVTERGGRNVVFVVENQKVSERPVGLGLGDDRIVEVLSGVREGEQIVVRGLETLADGTPIRISGS
jgi:RND family efflux transporter MFP subunit